MEAEFFTKKSFCTRVVIYNIYACLHRSTGHFRQNVNQTLAEVRGYDVNFRHLLAGFDKFRTYFNNDVVGTQIGGAMKNVIAIASGFIIGKGLGLNANASIITRDA